MSGKSSTNPIFWKSSTNYNMLSTNVTFHQTSLQITFSIRPLYKLQHIFLQIFGLFSTNLLKTLPKTALFFLFLDGFRPNNKQNHQKFSRASRAESLLYFYKFPHEFLQISAWFSTNFSMVFRIFYKLQFATKFFYKFHFFCLQMWFSENPCLQI